MRGGQYYPVVTIDSRVLAEKRIRLCACKHCGGQAEIRAQRQIKTSQTNTAPMMAWVVCTYCSVQTAPYGFVGDTALTFLMKVWNRTPRDGHYEATTIERGSHYGDGEGN